MDGHHHLRILILSVGTIVLVAGHGIVLYVASSHMALSTAAMLGVIALVVLRHLGLLGPLFALFRRRSRPDAQ